MKIDIPIDDELKERMESHPEVDWSAVVRQAIIGHLATLERLERMNEIAARSEATREDVCAIADSVNGGLTW